MTNTANMKNLTILGTFEGECADANITNLNGLDITREVWENVFNSDEYKKAIELGHYIGFLGHPEDPNCMDFEHACIVMTSGRIDDSGKVYGTFNLVDTPVGRIVKSFIDAGVTFGISVRGAGDIVDNSVDPETFVFRGFDIVTFPAYPESIPTFTAIAASSDVESQKKYKAVCASVNNNIDGLNTIESINIVQSQFAKQSNEYKALEERKQILSNDEVDINLERIEGMTQLYLSEHETNKKLNQALIRANAELKSTSSANARKMRAIKRITASQFTDLSDDIDNLSNKYDKLVLANQRLQDRNKVLSKINLKYKCKIDAANQSIADKDSIIASLQTKTVKTVDDLDKQSEIASNLGEKNKRLQSEITAAQHLIEEYQDAYAHLYAKVVGIELGDISVTASTSVKDLQKLVSNSKATPVYASVAPDYVEDIIESDEGLVTL